MELRIETDSNKAYLFCKELSKTTTARWIGASVFEKVQLIEVGSKAKALKLAKANGITVRKV